MKSLRQFGLAMVACGLLPLSWSFQAEAESISRLEIPDDRALQAFLRTLEREPGSPSRRFFEKGGISRVMIKKLLLPSQFELQLARVHFHEPEVRLKNGEKLKSALKSPNLEVAMKGLRGILAEANYNDSVRILMGGKYKVGSIFDDEFKLNTLENALKDSPERLEAVEFFLMGKVISSDSTRLFKTPERQKILSDLIASGLVSKFSPADFSMADSPEDSQATKKNSKSSKSSGSDPKSVTSFYALNQISILPYSLGADDSNLMYIISDQPEKISGIKGATGEVSTTSHHLLGALEDLKADSYSGLCADFGSGVGIQAIALLKMQPHIKKCYALEIDRHAMHLGELNARLNEVGDRYQTVDNQDPSELRRTLQGEKLSIAVANPPFNIVPKELSKEMDAYGNGGPLGLDVTEIFLKQVRDNLGTSGEFIFYSELAKSTPSEQSIVGPEITGLPVHQPVIYALETLTQKWMPRGYQVRITECNWESRKFSKITYALGLANYIARESSSSSDSSSSSSPPNSDALFQITLNSLNENHVDEIVPAVVKIFKGRSFASGSRILGISRFCAGTRLSDFYGRTETEAKGSTDTRTMEIIENGNPDTENE